MPQAEIGEISCAYESPDERRVWVEADGSVIDSVDFTENRQPIIQRFIKRFEAGIDGAEFPFGIEFALRVSEDVITLPCPANSGFSPAVI